MAGGFSHQESDTMTWDHLHDEDILYEFRGERPDELQAGRFYRGVVDGFADFGVFVRIGDAVTGLLHRSQLDTRLENLDWSEGDAVIVQVENVQNNGNVDLTWSIRQSDHEFRGRSIHDPNGTSVEAETTDDDETEPTEQSTDPPEASTMTDRTPIVNLTDAVGSTVLVEGVVSNVRQTSGPTIFTVSDETGTVDCAAFEAAGIRAYPAITADDAVEVLGEVEHHRGDIQLECDEIAPLEGRAAEATHERLTEALNERARPDDLVLLTDDPVLEAILEDLAAVTTAIRRAVIERTPIIVRHPATVDGVVGGAALERAVVGWIEDVHGEAVERHRLVRRRPLRDAAYDLGDAMYDVDRDGKQPFVLLVGAGTSQDDISALEFLSLFGVEGAILDANSRPVSVPFGPAAIVGQDRTATTVAATVAALVDPRTDHQFVHLPAVSYEDAPEAYRELAATHGYDDHAVSERHDAIALVAFYQRYDDKRELVEDLLFDGDAAGELAGHISTQYRDRLETALDTAERNADRISTVNGVITILDAEADTHRFEFPPTHVLVDALHAARDGSGVTAVHGFDECWLSGIDPTAIPTIVAEVQEQVPDAGVEETRHGIRFLSGRRDAVRGALVESLTAQLA